MPPDAPAGGDAGTDRPDGPRGMHGSSPPDRGLTRAWSPASRVLLAIVAGALCGSTFAPLQSALLSIAALAVLAALLRCADRPRTGALLGFAFGLGTFTVGLAWLYVSLHHYGEMPAALAIAGVLLFAAYLALFPMMAGIVTVATRQAGPTAFVATFGASIALSECARGWLFTGFSWLSPGYAQVDSPLAGFAPVLGVYGVGGLAAVVAAALALAVPRPGAVPASGLRSRMAPVALILTVAMTGQWLRGVEWSQPTGHPVRIRLVQGNIDQSVKFDPTVVVPTMEAYIRHITQQAADLTILPETAWTVPLGMTPQGQWDALHGFIERTGTSVAIGAPFLMTQARMATVTRGLRDGMPVRALERLEDDSPERLFFNGLIVLDRAALARPDLEPFHYFKHHLVPFGEFVPWGFRWFVDQMNIPLGDQGRGPRGQASYRLGDQRIAFDICYEDLFGEELLGPVRNGASILANVTNIAWFGRSWALPQHLQIARMRTLETARPVVRATNTGTTAAIDHGGRVIGQLPVMQAGAMDADVQGREGLTPYVRTGNTVVAGVALGTLLACLALARRRRTTQTAMTER